jgi:deoxycytidine triphosphate deaminase
MGFLTGIEIRRRIESGEIEIYSLDPQEPFNMDAQVSEDAIDLRLAPGALVLREQVERLDYLNDEIDRAYELIEIPPQGYDLQPLRPLLTQSLEAVCFPEHLVGLVLTRSSFARLGVMANCMAPKFAAGIRWAFPLQLVNLSHVPVRIYPYSGVAQLMISDMTGVPVGYRGKFQDSYSLTPPVFTSKEQQAMTSATPEDAVRTFHIVTKDLLSRSSGVRVGSANSDGPRGTNVTQPRIGRGRRGFRIAASLVLSTIAALGFGIAGNILSQDDIEYWKGVSVGLILLISAIAIGEAVALQARHRSESGVSMWWD